MAVLPGAGVLLVHYCDDEVTRAACRICPDVTPELAACRAVQALAAAGVEREPGEVWSTVRQAVAEQLTWRRTVAGLAAGEEADEPDTVPLTRVLQHAGAAGPGPLDWHAAWSDAVDPPTDRLVLPGDWREHTAPVPPASATRYGDPVETRRHATARTLLSLLAVAAMVAAGAVYVVATRPAWHHVPGPGAPREQADPPAEQLDRGAAGGGGAAPDVQPRPGETTSNPPTPTPAPSPSSSPSGQVGGRTKVQPPPAPSPAPSSRATTVPTTVPTAAPTTAAPTGPPQEDPGEPAPSPSDTAPAEPSPSAEAGAGDGGDGGG